MSQSGVDFKGPTNFCGWEKNYGFLSDIFEPQKLDPLNILCYTNNTCILLSSFSVTFQFLIPEKKHRIIRLLHSGSSDEGVWSDSDSVSVHSGPPLTDVVMQCHRPPLDWNTEEGRLLQRMATRGGREGWKENSVLIKALYHDIRDIFSKLMSHVM